MRLIDADALMWKLQSRLPQVKAIPTWILDAILDEPTIDAVQIIRCKDCKYYDTPKNFKKPYCVRGAYVKVEEDDYCSKGERK